MGISGYTDNYNLVKYESGSENWGDGVNNNMDVIDAAMKGIDDKSLTAVQKIGLTGGNYTSLHLHTGILSYKAQWVLAQKNAFWGDVFYGSTSTVIIRPKKSPFGTFIGVILNDGEYIESTSIITVSLTNDKLNGGIATQNNSWYILIPYKNSSSELAFGFSWMPITTFTETSPTTDLTLAQVDSKDIGLCFPEKAELVVWDSSTKFETPIFYYGGSYNAAGELYTSSRNSTTLTLNKSLSISSLSGGKYVYQVSGFQPIDYSTGNIISLIGNNGWNDTGIRIRTDGSGNILPFIIVDGKFYFANGIGSADVDRNNGLGHYIISSTSYVEYRETYIPPDKSVIISYLYGENWALSERNYYDTYGVLTHCFGASGALETLRTERNCLHAISSMKYTVNTVGTATLGYVI